jgi:O-succinylbenzoate synthase
VPVCAFQSPEIGNSFLKIKVGHLTLKEAIKLARQYYLNYRLRIDCNQKWSLDEALYFTSHFSPNDFDYLEEPVGNLNDLITLSKKTNFPIAVDELALNPLIAQIPTLKAIVAKPMLLGKIPTHPIIPTILSSTYETSLGHLLIARQASEKSLPLGLGTFSLCSDNILSPPLTSAEGFLQWNPSGPPINLSKLCLIAHAP